MQREFIPIPLPLKADIETPEVLRKLATANRPLAELKGISQTIPNPSILVSTLALQEAKDSSEIENIVTTHDDLFRAGRDPRGLIGPSKEVIRYASAISHGFEILQKNGALGLRSIIEVHSTLCGAEIGFRKNPGTALKNDATGEIIFTPPQHPDTVRALMENFEMFVNGTDGLPSDPLLRMIVMHHQFETIHPFPDGNGRTGRILNVLHLVMTGLLDLPILYMSRFITSTKQTYYALLQKVRDTGEWQDWVLYMLEGVETTARHAINLVNAIKTQMSETKNTLRTQLPKIYSQDLLNNVFRHPYTKIGYVEEELSVSRVTATKYLEALIEVGILSDIKSGRDRYFVNDKLIQLFFDIPRLGVK